MKSKTYLNNSKLYPNILLVKKRKEYADCANINENTSRQTEKIYYQSSFGGWESAGLSSSLTVLRGRGAKPPKQPQNSPLSESAINFPSSAWESKHIHPVSNTRQSSPLKLKNILTLTNRSYLTFPIMVGILDILYNFQCFSPFLNTWIGTIKLEDFGLGIQNKNIIMVQWRSSESNL